MSLLNYANLIVLGVSILVCAYAFYQGYKLPNVVEQKIYTNKISRNLRIVQISDMHITRATPISRVAQIVNMVNNLSPGVIVLTGDTIDDNINLIEKQLNMLREFSATIASATATTIEEDEDRPAAMGTSPPQTMFIPHNLRLLAI